MDAFDIIAVLVALFPVLVLVVVNAAESLKSDPQLSNREHERRTGTHKNTVQAVREELEGSGQIAHFEKRQDPRTGNLSQPASQPPRPEPEPEHATLVPKPELTPRPLRPRPHHSNSSHFVTRGVPRVPAHKSRKGVGLCTHPAK